jgi:tol-pal system protein YbgF
MKHIAILIVVAASLFASSHASAKTPEERIANLEEQLTTIQKTYLTNNQGAASAVAQIQSINEEWGVLKGKVDSNTQLIRMQSEELMRTINALENRVQSIEDRMQIFSEQLTKALSKVSPDAAQEGELYQKGLDQVNSVNYLEAASTFEKFLKSYPNSSFAPSVLSWIGECFYSSRDYQRAIKEYERYIEKYPHDKGVPTAILKQGNSFYELGMLDEAKAFYQKVIQSYPTSGAASEAKGRLARIEEKKNAPPAAESQSQLSTYPAETLEQKRQHMMQGTEGNAQKPPAQPPAKKVGPPQKDF